MSRYNDINKIGNILILYSFSNNKTQLQSNKLIKKYEKKIKTDIFYRLSRFWVRLVT